MNGLRSRLRFSLRGFFVFVAVVAIGLVAGQYCWNRVLRQRHVVAQIRAAGGEARYDYQLGLGPDLDLPEEFGWKSVGCSKTDEGLEKYTRTSRAGTYERIERPPGPEYVRRMLGDDVFASVEEVCYFRWEDLLVKQRPPIEDIDAQLLLQLPHLKVLTPRGSQVTDDWLASAAKIPELRILSIGSGAQVTADGLAKLKSAGRLRSLNLSGDWLNDETLRGVAELPQLRTLSLGDTPHLSSACFRDLAALGDLEQLQVFRLPQIDDQGAEHLPALKKLLALDLFESSISDETARQIAELTALESLELSRTRLTDAGLARLARLTKLKRLSLGRTAVGDAGVMQLGGLTQLSILNVSGTKITDDSLPVIARLINLEMLNLHPTSMTDAGLVQLRELQHLKFLSVGPHVSAAAAENLQLALPQCHVSNFEENGRSR